MNLQHRIDLFVELGNYLKKNEPGWQEIKEKAAQKNNWFSIDFIDIAVKNIIEEFLQKDKLKNWAAHYYIDDPAEIKNVGIVMAGNIPLVGFHDLLSVFISGHRQTVKLSSKDDVLPEAIINYLYSLDEDVRNYISIADTLRGCNAYIATGSNQTSKYFEQYFSKYPNIIRKNKTSVAILTGNETTEELEKLSDDIHLFFGLGCRNVTKIYVPAEYDFVPLLSSFKKYKHFRDHHKYANNYDYQLSLMLLNNQFYMTNESTLLAEQESVFSAISILHYGYYEDAEKLSAALQQNEDIQCIVGPFGIPFGQAQEPGLFNYADGVDTMAFLLTLG